MRRASHIKIDSFKHKSQLNEANLQTATSGSESGLFVASVEKAFRVLDLFKVPQADLGLTEVAARSGIGKSAAQRFLYTLQMLGYLKQNPISKTFRLSSKLFELSASYMPGDLLREKAEPILGNASRRCAETMNLTILDGTDVTYVLRYPSKHVVSVNLVVGTRLPAFCTAPGRVLLAYSDEKIVDAALSKALLVRRTEFSKTNPAELRKILRQVRRQGYSVCNQEAFLGDISIAAPVLNDRGLIVAAVNIAVPYPRWSVAKAQKQLVPVIRKVAREVSAALGANNQHAE